MPPGDTLELYRCQYLTATGERCKRHAHEYRQTSGGVTVAACWQHLDACYPTPYWTTNG